MKLQLVIAAISVSTIHSQDSFLGTPTRRWEANVPPMGRGNGVVVEPDGKAIFATSLDGTISALDPDDGARQWNYQPPGSSGSVPLSSNGQVAISSDKKFMVYSVTESEDSDDAICKVVALGNPAGDLLWISSRLEGACSGTPVLSNDGKLVYLTHNSQRKTVGHFSILAGANGQVLFSRQNTVAPYAPPGYVWNPTEGNFDDNTSNKRDVVIWSYMPTPNADGVGPGRTFAFQLNRDFNNNTADFGVDVLLGEVDWQSTTAPLIANKGLSMYWSVSRSKLRGWVRSANSTGDDGKFDTSRTGEFDFDRGEPSWLAGFSTPQVDDPDDPKILCTAGASADFYCLNARTFAEEWKETTDSLIYAEARFSTKGDRVYFVEEDGTIQSFNAAGGRTKHWEERVSNKVLANFDLSNDGGMMYVGDESGRVSAYQLSSTTPPPVTPATREPSAAPSMAPPSAPTATRSPNAPPTARPTPQPTSGSAVVTKSNVASLATTVVVAMLM